MWVMRIRALFCFGAVCKFVGFDGAHGQIRLDSGPGMRTIMKPLQTRVTNQPCHSRPVRRKTSSSHIPWIPTSTPFERAPNRLGKGSKPSAYAFPKNLKSDNPVTNCFLVTVTPTAGTSPSHDASVAPESGKSRLL